MILAHIYCLYEVNNALPHKVVAAVVLVRGLVLGETAADCGNFFYLSFFRVGECEGVLPSVAVFNRFINAALVKILGFYWFGLLLRDGLVASCTFLELTRGESMRQSLCI